MNWVKKIKALPTGYSEMSFAGKKYGVTRKDFNNGKSTKIYAKEAGGNHFISCNCYFTEKGALLKPCEMPEKKVIYFLEHAKHWINKLR